MQGVRACGDTDLHVESPRSLESTSRPLWCSSLLVAPRQAVAQEPELPAVPRVDRRIPHATFGVSLGTLSAQQ